MSYLQTIHNIYKYRINGILNLQIFYDYSLDLLVKILNSKVLVFDKIISKYVEKTD